ncbi:response regulator [Cohnella lupini]|uniref:Two-component system response regulator YesN n=1 Tax=Cohnella lupini TaxID=1294267 RepID=A0A3D9I2B4_9BACL|nr:response regulator [Cohnella lupini]RED55296.1 two-component system response regulator YesN [Cohnella lupini]
MYKVMIVEDSKPILRNIKVQIESADNRLLVTHTAFNGAEALEMLKSNPVDIVFTDIRMPRMDGLTFIRLAKEIRPEVRYFLLSGFDDFEYARQAIKLSVCEYLLKPLDSKELNATLQKTIFELEGERENDEQEAFTRLINPYMASDENKHPLPGPYYVLLVLRSGYLRTGGYSWDKNQLLGVCRRIFPEAACRVADTPADSEKAIIIGWSDARDAIEPDIRFDRLIRALRSENSRANGIFTALQSDPSKIKALYGALSAILDENVSLSGSGVFSAEETPVLGRRLRETDENYRLRLTSLIKQGQKDNFSSELAAWMNECERHAIAVPQIRTTLRDLVEALRSALHRESHDLLPSDGLLDEAVYKSSTHAELNQRLSDIFIPIFDDGLHGRLSSKETFDAIEAYCRANLAKPVGLQDLCRELAYSPSYIIRIVKKFTGLTPVEYYRQLQMKHAQKLLANNERLLIKDIADALGFGDQHYFCKVFKQYSGCSPSEYKKKIKAPDEPL